MKRKNAVILGIAIGALVLGLIAAIVFLVLPSVLNVTVKFDADGGKEVASLKIKRGSTITLPETTKEGYTLDGWYIGEEQVTTETKITKNITVKAHWSEVGPNTFTITFESNGGSAVEPLVVECGKELVLPAAPKKTGYVFGTWKDQNEVPISDGALLACEDLTLYAYYDKESAKTFTVTFDSKGGSTVKSITVECGKTLPTLPTPTKSGYNFVAWTDKNGKAILTGALLTCGNITLIADWKAKTYSCPEGYSVSGTNCIAYGTVRERCPSGTVADGSICIKTSDSNGGTRVCNEDTVAIDGKGHTYTGGGDYYMVGNSYGKCAYYKWTNYKTQSQCTGAYDVNHKTVWVSELSACYAETKMNNYHIECASNYKLYNSSELSSKFGIHDNSKCLRVVDKEKYCDSNYVFTGGKCVKTIKATEN